MELVTLQVWPKLRVGDTVTVAYTPSRSQRLLVALRLRKPYPATKTYTISTIS